ncbi:MAG: nucleotide-binding protein [Bosea sp.]|uniref:nucleotide-binding protein n=1 Tax=Bosea sp. (in: a-proteobacteria) TaxID=1871050 RepID=UPI001ACF2BCE|nr:nucleotide-binding protein [Bosea sp. (in: a-proteobacteria)]MBN9452941.1 nucleotide-binding protein [Bosea sp. (in: a-proteobacteria)]
MARRPPPEPQRRKLSVDEMEQGIQRLSRRLSELEAFDVDKIQERNSPAQRTLEVAIADTLRAIFGENTPEFRQYAGAARLNNGPIAVAGSWANRGLYDEGLEIRRYLDEGKARGIALLELAIKSLTEEIEFASPVADLGAPLAKAGPPSKQVFVVHGHDVATREAVARFLQRAGLDPVILHEKANEGKTIIEKFEANSAVGFAVVLLTPDDVGGPKDGQTSLRARQNVILELGYFIGKLGRGNVCALKSGDIELPSDILGIAWTSLDDNGWRTELARELRSAGYKIDLEALFG